MKPTGPILGLVFLMACGGAWHTRGSDDLGLHGDAFDEIAAMLAGDRVIEAKTALDRLPGNLRDSAAWAYLMGRAFMAEGDLGQAVTYLEMARQRRPDSPVIENDYGVALVMAGRAREAVAVLDELGKDLPQDREVRLNRAAARVSAGSTAEGRDSLARMAAAEPEWFEARYNHGVAALAAMDTDTAVVEFQAALKLKVGDRNALLGLSTACVMNNNIPCAENSARELVARYPTDPESLMAWASYLETHGDKVKAMEEYRRAVAIGPACGDCWYNLGRLSEKRGDIPAATDAYRKYLGLAPRDSNVDEIRLRLKALSGGN